MSVQYIDASHAHTRLGRMWPSVRPREWERCDKWPASAETWRMTSESIVPGVVVPIAWVWFVGESLIRPGLPWRWAAPDGCDIDEAWTRESSCATREEAQAQARARIDELWSRR